MNRCAACTVTISPAEGPGILWAPDAAAPREVFHLSCWLLLREAEHASPESDSAPRSRELQAA